MPCSGGKCVLSQHALQVESQHALQQGGLLLGGTCSREGCLLRGGGVPAPGGICSHLVPAPGGGACSQGDPPKVDGYCFGRYASYWNAFLLLFRFLRFLLLQVERLGNQIQVLNTMEADVNFQYPDDSGPRQQYQQPTTSSTTTTSPTIPTSITTPSTVSTTPEFDFQNYCSEGGREKGKF